MDAVELPLPAVVPVPELLTSKGFGKAGVAAEKTEAREPDCVSILVSPSITGFSSSRSHKDVTCTVTAPGHISASMDNKADTELYRPGSQVPRFQGRNIAIHLSCRDANSSLFLLPKRADKQLHRKAGKESSNSPCSKRPRTAHVEDFISQPGVDDRNVLSEKLGSSLTKCTFAEKSRVIKQKHSVDRKRGDRRNLKAPKKAKFESFFSDALTTNSAAGGNNILGIYGLKSAIHDVTKHVDELSLNELLDDNYKCPILCQEKGKKATNMNENIIHSVRMACSILQLQRPVHSQNAVHLDSSSNGKMPTCLLRSASCVISSIDCGKGDNYTTDLTSCRKVSWFQEENLRHWSIGP